MVKNKKSILSKMFESIKSKSFSKMLLNPIYLHSFKLSCAVEHAVKQCNISELDNWLDVGCGLKPYKHNFSKCSYVGIDVKVSGSQPSAKEPDLYFDGELLPFADNSFDGVISTQVFEHVSNPEMLLSEVYRVLKPRGSFIIAVPLVWQEHEVPFDFYRFTSFGIKKLLENVGFTVDKVTKINRGFEALAICFNAYIVSNIMPSSRIVQKMLCILVCFPSQIIALLLNAIFKDQGMLYTNLICISKKIER